MTPPTKITKTVMPRTASSAVAPGRKNDRLSRGMVRRLAFSFGGLATTKGKRDARGTIVPHSSSACSSQASTLHRFPVPSMN